MIINYDMQKINQSLQDFYNATGINMVLIKDDFTYVSDRRHWEQNRYCKAIQNTPEGQEVCLHSDLTLLNKCKDSKKAEMHICHAGLVDVAIPILYDDNIIGYIMFGQMKTDMDFSVFEKYISNLKLNTTEMNEYYTKIPFFDSDKIQSVSNIASMFGKYILLENLLKPNFDEKIQIAVTFIDQNLEKDLTIQTISKSINISKSVLYRLFHDCFNCTISEYINKKRIEKSILLLTETDLSIEEISQRVGFSSASYYGKIFKKFKNDTPLKYKKRHEI